MPAFKPLMRWLLRVPSTTAGPSMRDAASTSVPALSAATSQVQLDDVMVWLVP